MRTNGNKVLIIVLIVIAVLAIVGGVFAYLILGTDTFKSSQELFAKYLTQNMNQLGQTASLGQIEQLQSKIKQNSYEESITISYTEEDAEEAVGKIIIDTQNDPINKKNYGIVGLSMDGLDEALEVEYMKENDMYSLRFTNSVKQFLSIENKNLQEFAKILGMNEEDIEQIPDKIDFEKFSFDELEFTEEEKQTELNKYASVIYNNIAKEKYTKTKNAVITVNGKTITTNAYTLTLDIQELKTIGIEVLETLKQDEIILSKLEILNEKLEEYSEESIKDVFVDSVQEAIDGLKEEEVTEDKITITVYEQNKNTVRIKAEQGLQNITLDTISEEGKIQINLNYTSIDEEDTQSSNEITFIKESDNKLLIQYSAIEGEEQQGANITAQVVENGDNVKLDVVVDTEYGQIEFTRDVTIVNEIDYAITLDSTNNVVLNELTAEQIQNILNAVRAKLMTDYVEPLEVIAEPLMMILVPGYGMEETIPDDFSEMEDIGLYNEEE